MIKRTCTFICLLLAVSFVKAQELKHYTNFEEFKPMLENAQSDTLLVFNFWATWCRPCVKELPYFVKLDSAYANKKVKVIFVSIDEPNLIESRVKPFVQRRKISQEVVVMTDVRQNEWIPQISEAWTGSIPATLVVEANSGIKAFKEQSFTYAELSSWIDELLLKRDSN